MRGCHRSRKAKLNTARQLSEHRHSCWRSRRRSRWQKTSRAGESGRSHRLESLRERKFVAGQETARADLRVARSGRPSHRLRREQIGRWLRPHTHRTAPETKAGCVVERHSSARERRSAWRPTAPRPKLRPRVRRPIQRKVARGRVVQRSVRTGSTLTSPPQAPIVAERSLWQARRLGYHLVFTAVFTFVTALAVLDAVLAVLLISVSSL